MNCRTKWAGRWQRKQNFQICSKAEVPWWLCFFPAPWWEVSSSVESTSSCFTDNKYLRWLEALSPTVFARLSSERFCSDAVHSQFRWQGFLAWRICWFSQRLEWQFFRLVLSAIFELNLIINSKTIYSNFHSTRIPEILRAF